MDFFRLLEDPRWQSELWSFLVVAVVFVVMFFLFRRDKQQQHRLLEEVSLAMGGHIEPGSFFSFPVLVIPAEGAEARIRSYPGSRNSEPRTVFTFQRQAPFTGKIDVFRKSILQARLALWGMKAVDINSPVFNDSFKVLASDESGVLNLLSIEAQADLLGIKELNPLLMIRGPKLTLTVRTHFKQAAPLKDFIKTGMALSRQFVQLG